MKSTITQHTHMYLQQNILNEKHDAISPTNTTEIECYSSHVLYLTDDITNTKYNTCYR